MNVVDIVRVLMDETLGNAGAVRNCRTELVGRRDADRQVDALCRRMPPVRPTTEVDDEPEAATA